MEGKLILEFHLYITFKLYVLIEIQSLYCLTLTDTIILIATWISFFGYSGRSEELIEKNSFWWKIILSDSILKFYCVSFVWEIITLSSLFIDLTVPGETFCFNTSWRKNAMATALMSFWELFTGDIEKLTVGHQNHSFWEVKKKKTTTKNPNN